MELTHEPKAGIYSIIRNTTPTCSVTEASRILGVPPQAVLQLIRYRQVDASLATPSREWKVSLLSVASLLAG